MAVPPADVNFDNVASLQNIVDKWTAQYAATSEMHDAAVFARVPFDKQVSARGIEVGHIFYFGTKYSDPMKAVVATHDGKEVPVHIALTGLARAAWSLPSSKHPMTMPVSSGRSPWRP